MHLIPAYGRDYKSKKEIQADLEANKDFVIADMSSQYDGKPVNLEQLQEAGERTINVRYKRLTEVTVFQVAKLKRAG
jgi:hypothetical protein